MKFSKAWAGKTQGKKANELKKKVGNESPKLEPKKTVSESTSTKEDVK